MLSIPTRCNIRYQTISGSGSIAKTTGKCLYQFNSEACKGCYFGGKNLATNIDVPIIDIKYAMEIFKERHHTNRCPNNLADIGIQNMSHELLHLYSIYCYVNNIPGVIRSAGILECNNPDKRFDDCRLCPLNKPWPFLVMGR